VSNALYHEALVAKARSGIGKGRLTQPNASAQLDNPLCGDRVTLDLYLVGECITQVGHEVRGCLLCEAAAAVIAELTPGRTPAEVRDLSGHLTLMMQEGTAPGYPVLDIFTPVINARSRRDCVLLPFNTLTKALANL